MIQYGYVVYFSVTWPMAPLVCALHTAFRLRSNVLRLTKCSMRPRRLEGTASASIGLWETLLSFELHSGVLINCLLITLSTDELDYASCWLHSLFGDGGGCVAAQPPGGIGGGMGGDEGGGMGGGGGDGVPLTARFLIAVIAEHVLLGLVFIFNAAVPARDAAFNVRLKKAAFQFKRRYLAEAMMMDEAPAALATAPGGGARGGGADGGSPSSLGGRGAADHPAVAPLPGALLPGALGDAIDYDGEWRSGSELSDAYESGDDTRGADPAMDTPRRTHGGVSSAGLAASRPL